MKKFLSRKFIMAVAAFFGSIGTGIVGMNIGNERIVMCGAVCSVLSAALYAACEAYVDGRRKE